jgi:SAM-dependent methyltransferase
MTDALTRWRSALESWAIPPEILAAAPESPWTLGPGTFVARARRQVAGPSGESYDRAIEALPAGGSVLDVGVGAGAASLPLAARAARLTGVDTNRSLLETFVELARDRHVDAETVVGAWPDCASSVAVADVVVCHHVLYNVADLAPFVTALSAYARNRVVVEISATHPMVPWNPLWERFHGLERPVRPTASDAVEAIAELGFAPMATGWERPATLDAMSYDELVATTCRRLCLGPERANDVDVALRDLGVDPAAPTLGGPTRQLVTIWWPGTAD